MKKQLYFFTGFLLLNACGINRTEDAATDGQEESELSVSESEMEEAGDRSETEGDVEGSHLLADFIHESTFMDPYALQAWQDYQAIVADVIYGEIMLIQTDNPDVSQLDGSSYSEIEEKIGSLNLREDIYMEQVDINEAEKLYFYRYPAEADSEYSEISDFLVELSFYFIDDHLIYSSITPGLYQLELNDLPSADTLTTFMTVPEIASVNPQVFTIAEMQVNDSLIQQTMIPSTFINEEGNEDIMAFYFFTQGEDILHYAFLPFEMVSQSFPDNSILLYQQVIPELAEMNSEETL